jgi:hypothetical protein
MPVLSLFVGKLAWALLQLGGHAVSLMVSFSSWTWSVSDLGVCAGSCVDINKGSGLLWQVLLQQLGQHWYYVLVDSCILLDIYTLQAACSSMLQSVMRK